jgi:hypothetical protein
MSTSAPSNAPLHVAPRRSDPARRKSRKDVPAVGPQHKPELPTPPKAPPERSAPPLPPSSPSNDVRDRAEPDLRL